MEENLLRFSRLPYTYLLSVTLFGQICLLSSLNCLSNFMWFAWEVWFLLEVLVVLNAKDLGDFFSKLLAETSKDIYIGLGIGPLRISICSGE